MSLLPRPLGPNLNQLNPPVVVQYFHLAHHPSHFFVDRHAYLIVMIIRLTNVLLQYLLQYFQLICRPIIPPAVQPSELND